MTDNNRRESSQSEMARQSDSFIYDPTTQLLLESVRSVDRSYVTTLLRLAFMKGWSMKEKGGMPDEPF